MKVIHGPDFLHLMLYIYLTFRSVSNTAAAAFVILVQVPVNSIGSHYFWHSQPLDLTTNAQQKPVVLFSAYADVPDEVRLCDFEENAPTHP